MSVPASIASNYTGDVLNIEIDRIEPTPAKATRSKLDEEWIKQLASEGDLDPILIVIDGEGRHWTSDGAHRIEAHKMKGASSIRCRWRQGTYEDAFGDACRLNKAHGNRTKEADKKAQIIEARKRWPEKTQAEIAELCDCSQQYVSRIVPVSQDGPISGHTTSCSSNSSTNYKSPSDFKSEPRFKPPAPSKTEQAIEMLSDPETAAMSNVQIAKQLDVTEALVRKARRQAGIPSSSRPGRPKPEQPSSPEPITSPQTDEVEHCDPGPNERRVKGVGIDQAYAALNCLTRIPRNDPFRKRGLQIVMDWIRKNE